MQINKKLNKIIYSTEEVFTGEYVGNKKVYTKEFKGLASGTATMPMGNNVENVIDISGYYYGDNPNFRTIPMGDNGAAGYDANNHVFNYYFNASGTYTYDFIVKYTKTN